ncbi:hypothetical protein R1flu_028987 [Riccia fluitans]|uniref:PGG domain-containing protein n=1 Tax=Riccia fluitans TaxID=41844 RepID=A0ABD1XNB0_9MARC
MDNIKVQRVYIDERSAAPYGNVEDVRQWYKVLVEEDCMEIKRLLDENPRLLQLGWRRKESVKLVYTAPFAPQSEHHVWKGRTALHVSVKKGWISLVRLVLALEKLESMDGPESFGNFLIHQDGYSALNALAMAVICGNSRIINILADASLQCQNNPYGITRDFSTAANDDVPDDKYTSNAEDACHVCPWPERSACKEAEHSARFLLSEQVKKTREDTSEASWEYIHKRYEEDADYNFLPWEDYIFHFICKRILPRADETNSSNRPSRQPAHVLKFLGKSNKLDPILTRFGIILVSLLKSLSQKLVVRLFERRDSQGRTPLHVAVDNFTVPEVLGELIPKGNGFKPCLNAVDAAGRTPLYTAAAIRRIWYYQVEALVEDNRTDLNAVFSPPVRDWPFDMDNLSRMNGYKGTLEDVSNGQVRYEATALHMAIIRGNAFSLESLPGADKLDREAKFRREVEFDDSLTRYGRRITKFWSTPLQLAAMLHPTDSHNQVLSYLFKDDRLYDVGRLKNLSSPPERSDSHSVLHYAAFAGNSDAVKIILASNQFDHFTLDAYNNTALHYAVDARGKLIRTHLLDRVNCWWKEYWNLGVLESNKDDQNYLEFQREQTIDHLVQAGMDMWKVNIWGNSPNPGPWASPEAKSRWNKRMEIRTLEVQARLNSAGGAISVTGALVAAASYVGPLQPPLGYDGTSDLLQTMHLPVRIFIVCNTLSFYLAISSITLALIPSLPGQGGAMVSHATELQKIQTALMIASLFLFLSILNVVMAFAAASIAVISVSESWTYGGLTLSTAAVGALVCLPVMGVCVRKMVKTLLLHKPVARNLLIHLVTIFQRSAEVKDPYLKYRRARLSLSLKLEVDDAALGGPDLKFEEAWSSDGSPREADEAALGDPDLKFEEAWSSDGSPREADEAALGDPDLKKFEEAWSSDEVMSPRGVNE